VPLPQVVIDALAAHLAVFPAARVEILDATRKPDPKRRPAALVFTSLTGPPLRRTRFSDIWRPAAAAAGLGDGVTFHDLRHYTRACSSAMMRASRWCRSASAMRAQWRPSTTYSHLWPDSEDRTREAVDEVLGRATGGAVAEAAP
jgi:integrase